MNTNTYTIYLDKVTAQLEEAFKQKEENLGHPIILDGEEIRKTTTICYWTKTEQYDMHNGWVIKKNTEYHSKEHLDVTYELEYDDETVFANLYHGAMGVESEDDNPNWFRYFKLKNEDDTVYEIPTQLYYFLKHPEDVARDLRLVRDNDE